MGFASVHLIDDAPSWLLILTVGLIFSTLGVPASLAALAQTNAGNSIIETTSIYIFPLGIAFSALPALILFDRDTSLSPWNTASVLIAIALPLALWFSTLTMLGLNGMAAGFVNYSDRFAPGNLATSTNVLLFVVFYLITLTAVRRATK